MSSQISHKSCTILRKHLTHCDYVRKAICQKKNEAWYTPRDVNVTAYDFVGLIIVKSIRILSNDDNMDYYDCFKSQFSFLASTRHTLLF